ncbi:RERGL [Acanthosepion pharaonis]|uniref:small monomeric GTPase n=1 Tax=Acanthosepion pharaonis TaxID=158019 RepID=A0A812E234_ACAPH|nr:RERGL [Sepia pharaonis]
MTQPVVSRYKGLGDSPTEMRTYSVERYDLSDNVNEHNPVTVRFLTKRFIGEYNSDVDLLYRSNVRHDENLTDVEILDSCTKKSEPLSPTDNQLSWADAFIIVYNICERQTFHWAKLLVDHVHKRRSPVYVPVLLLGNKTDLEHRRQVGVDDGHQVALEYGCMYYEVSAADNYVSISVAFQSLLREARIVQQHRSALLKRRKSSLMSVSRRLGAMFGKSGHNKDGGDTERQSVHYLSIYLSQSVRIYRRLFISRSVLIYLSIY